MTFSYNTIAMQETILCAAPGCKALGCKTLGRTTLGCKVLGCNVLGCKALGCKVLGCKALGCKDFRSAWRIAAGLFDHFSRGGNDCRQHVDEESRLDLGSLYGSICAHTYIHIYICKRIYIYTHNTYTYAHMYICIYIHMFICIHIYDI